MSARLILIIAQRLGLGIALLFAVSVLIFVGTEVLPGDVAQAVLGQGATPEAVAKLRGDFGLDRPASFRYLEWLAGILHGDLGVSYTSHRDIASAITKSLGNTLFLAFSAACIAIPLAIGLAVVAVRYRDTLIDRAISVATLSSMALPEFFSGYLLILLFAINLQWLPSTATVYDSMSVGQHIEAMILPVTTLVLVVVGYMMRMTRAAILNVLSSEYIEMAELKGLSQADIIWRHALPNSIAPIVNAIALTLAYLIVGVVVVEVVFVYPGLGQYMVDHVSKRDVPVVQACGLIFAAVYITLNMVADIVAMIANPRIRHPR